MEGIAMVVSWLVVLAVGGTLMTGASRLRSGNHGAATLAWAPLCQKEFRKAPAFDMISTALRIGELAGVGCREMHSCSSLIVCA
ncbi:hypothetical protein EDB19DRAFT_256120 [Suillus lakei]|nr:hypothetical protein EDB19DRAFT_256120 [Suillus lakei]